MAKFAFIGDINIEKKVKVDSQLQTLLNNCDFVVANMEGPILLKKLKKWKEYSPCIYNPFELIKDLNDQIKLTHVSIFNNHIGDYGLDGIYQTIENLNKLKIKILSKSDKISDTRIINTGLLEYGGYFYNSIVNKFGYRLFDLINSTDININKKNEKLLINAHFGVEAIKTLSNTELKIFESLLRFKPELLVRHHPHTSQVPFKYRGTNFFTSIGDFCFCNYLRELSEGLLVIFDEKDGTSHYHKINFQNRTIFLDKKRYFVENEKPKMINRAQIFELRKRILKEYRVENKHIIKKLIKKNLGLEKDFFSIYQLSLDHIQPYLINEIWNK